MANWDLFSYSSVLLFEARCTLRPEIPWPQSQPTHKQIPSRYTNCSLQLELRCFRNTCFSKAVSEWHLWVLHCAAVSEAKAVTQFHLICHPVNHNENYNTYCPAIYSSVKHRQCIRQVCCSADANISQSCGKHSGMNPARHIVTPREDRNVWRWQPVLSRLQGQCLLRVDN